MLEEEDRVVGADGAGEEPGASAGGGATTVRPGTCVNQASRLWL